MPPACPADRYKSACVQRSRKWVAGHDPADPRFDYKRPDPMQDPRGRPRFSPEQRRQAEAMLERLKGGIKRMTGLSPAALAIFNRPTRQ